ncbi:unnamed protein product [Sphenostylis stenocarpa]|uniref:DYW domain-containing protein n=1 Tax=Sphenostylis stenocarpa TaxID=92480 RepID=A0AA86VC65_9FABA|nr:unnamed protein product [Sphenostylis stenocarpa]
MSKTRSIAPLNTYPTFHSPRNKSNFAKSPNCFIFFRQSGTTCLPPPNFDLSFCSSVCVSATLSKATYKVALDKNAKILKFCQTGDLKNAMELLKMSEMSELELHTYCSVLQLCAELKCLEEGKMVHSIITSNGMEIDEFVGVKLVFMYVHCGDLDKGRQILDGFLGDKIYLWNLLMSKYAKIGKYEEAVSLIEKMQKLGIRGDPFTFTSMLKCYTALAKLRECKSVHGYAFKLGFGSYNAVVNSLIAAYFKSREVESAHNMFDELSEPDVVSWSSMINGYVMNGFSRKGLEFLIQMLNLGVEIELPTLVSVLMACAKVGNLSLGRALHAYGVKTGFSGDVMFDNTLLDMYSKCGYLKGATDVFVKMGETNIVSWTSIIAAYIRKGLYDEAIELFGEMQSKGLKPDAYTLSSVLHACAYSNSLDKGRDIHNFIKKNYMELHLPVSNALMNMYAKCGIMEEAHLIFSQIPVKDTVSWNTIIGGYSQNSLPYEALELFLDMQKQLKPNDITMACVLPACAGLAALEKGREIHGHILRKGYFSELHVSCALVDMYVKCGLVVLAQQLFDMIPKKDIILWTVMIAGYGRHGFGKEAVSTFEKMRIAGIQPEETCFSSILYACSHSGLVKEGWKFFDSMRSECNIEPKLEHYACMVDLLVRSGNLSNAYNFIETMPIKPDAAIWGALLSGCGVHHDVELAEKVAEHIFELEPENTRYYVLLANVYADAEKWVEVKKLQRKIGKGGFKKDQGCSWIEIQGKFNIFAAGDTSHPQAKRIDSLLRDLRMKMDRGGYTNKMRYALINPDDMNKEVLLCGHSEKLAMAFGILNLPPGKTVRVTKNLRVCADCHDMGKFMSKTTGRDIVLRDSNRFHHFKDGVCSCRGFW